MAKPMDPDHHDTEPSKEKERMRQWYVQNRKRVLARAHERYEADPEAVKARVRKWQKEHPERCNDWLRSWREKNRERYEAQVKRAYAARREKKYTRVSDEMLGLCRKDPRLAVGLRSIVGLDMAVCLECGEMHSILGPHIARQHMAVIAYRQKWGYTKNKALESARMMEARAVAGRRIAQTNHPTPPPVNHSNAAAGRRGWAGAREKSLNLRDAHLDRIIRGSHPPFTRKNKGALQKAFPKGGRPKLRVEEKQVFTIGQRIEKALKTFEVIFSSLRSMPKPERLDGGKVRSILEKMGHPGNVTAAVLRSDRPLVAARWLVSLDTRLTYDSVANYHKLYRKSYPKPQ